MLYPKSLAGRLEISNDIRANVEVNDPRTFHPVTRIIDIEQVRELSTLILRLEALSAAHHTPHPPASEPTSPKIGSARLAVTTSTSQTHAATPPSFLGPCIRDDMTDEELTLIIESLTTRAENTVSTMVGPLPSAWCELTCSISNT